ncbi:hypothetical protein [Dactylosporangium sp. CA-233914]|uniref:hypothetical protein n=1 Tax=Dactylosporangium sp. CA-233914 TaxID=3239934 RepID=UPI003D924F05
MLNVDGSLGPSDIGQAVHAAERLPGPADPTAAYELSAAITAAAVPKLGLPAARPGAPDQRRRDDVRLRRPRSAGAAGRSGVAQSVEAARNPQQAQGRSVAGNAGFPATT